ncbi:hypothetical protein IMCC3135_09735 [Granulosicoccus antarcticus IMCC3135]|uniref:Uncharacterized protein n=1 Tax=Granulosicoccus antarcticus IMCC3135 TaxID=1192854 RepID=A0A2Z2NLL0_9GAMM|nr:hypothetical protein IMCC3135_09735 [Granulosicoccus antarcticus IMCC3135]
MIIPVPNVSSIHGETIKTRDMTRKEIFNYVEFDYIILRYHSSKNNTSPVQLKLTNAD